MGKFVEIVTATVMPFVFCVNTFAATLGPQPGEVYREYVLNNGGNKNWRVTDPAATAEGAQVFLPNPILKLSIADLVDAVRAEVLVDRWGGHPKTTNKQIRFNGNAWILLPEISTTPAGHLPQLYYSQDNPIAEVPLIHLRQGTNTIEGTCGVNPKYNWGQWGLFSVMVRVYYNPAKKSHLTGSITSPASGAIIQDSPSISVQTSNASSVKRIDCIGRFRDCDYDGDGIYEEWVEHWRQPVKDGSAELAQHIGFDTTSPFSFTWDTSWVPDQTPSSISLIARIQNTSNVWYVTNSVTNLTLQRRDVSVRMYMSNDIPESFGVRNGGTKSCTIQIPPTEDLSKALGARIYLRTWNGADNLHDQPFKVNTWTSPVGGLSHFYKLSEWSVPLTVLKNGSNTISFSSDFPDHALEVLWPGPMLKIRTRPTASARKVWQEMR